MKKCCYIADFLSASECDALWQKLSSEEVTWQQEEFRIFGRVVASPRLTAWFGEPGTNYRYTGVDHVAEYWPTWLDRIREKLRSCCTTRFNFVILNRYLNGRDYMGWHSDAEKGASPEIASLSLGAKRPFRIEMPPRAGGHQQANRARYELAHGSLLIFDGHLRHQLPKSQRIHEERINLTFRQIA